VSWADFAREVFKQAGIECAVEGIPSSAYPAAAERPKNSRLECFKVNTVFDIHRPDWRIGLADILSDLKVGRS